MGKLEITEAIQWLIDQGKDVRSTIITGYWKDTGNVADMLEVNRLVLETVESRLDGAVSPIRRSSAGCWSKRVHRLAGPESSDRLLSGLAVRSAGSYIGPFTAIAPDCAVDDSEIEYSIILRGASIRGVRRIEASLIGHDAEVTPAPRVPRAHRLILGDHSKVQISS